MLAWILERFGLETAEGSSSRGGALGLRDVLRRVKRGYDVGIAPDGPRGPRRRAKPGVVAAARLSGIPIVPVAFAARPGKSLLSWDRTLVPFPFGRGLFLYGEPIRVPRDADADESARVLADVESALDRITDRADREVGARPEPDA